MIGNLFEVLNSGLPGAPAWALAAAALWGVASMLPLRSPGCSPPAS